MTRPDDGSIATFTGRRFRPLAPRAEDVDAVDVAHALAMQVRFTGHTRDRYSVAEHSVHVSAVAEAVFLRTQGAIAPKERAREVALWGLLHDASEAYLVDVPRPLKRHATFAPYRDAERHLMLTIARRFLLRPPIPEVVHEADAALCAAEAHVLMPRVWRDDGRSIDFGPVVPEICARIACWSPEEAKARFLERFRELGGGGGAP